MTATPKKDSSKSLNDLLGAKKDDNLDDSSSTSSTVADHEHDYVAPGSDSGKANDDKPYYSDNVTAYRADKTPAELASETPDETAKRYGIKNTVTQEELDNPRVQVYEDTKLTQIPSSTHLHPDVAKDLQNRGISLQGTDNAQVSRNYNSGYDFAPDAEYQDKGTVPVDGDKFDRDEDYDGNEDDDPFMTPNDDKSKNDKNDKNDKKDSKL